LIVNKSDYNFLCFILNNFKNTKLLLPIYLQSIRGFTPLQSDLLLLPGALIMMPTITAGMNQLPQHLISHGTALSNTMRQVAGSIGTAILVTIMTQQTTEYLANYTIPIH